MIWIEKKIDEQSEVVEVVVEIVEYIPQAAFAGIQRALQQELTFVQRVVPNIRPLFMKLEDTISNLFQSKLFGEKILPQIRNGVRVQIRQGGTIIPKREEMIDLNYQASTYECSHLIDSRKNREFFDTACYTNTMTPVRARIKKKGGKDGHNT